MPMSKQRGVSLVELMVSITIGLILLAGVLSIFLSSKVTYFANEKLARLQENGRVALNLVSFDVRTAGYPGCSRTLQVYSSLNTPTSTLWNYAIPLQGFESDGAGGYSPAVGIALNPAPIANSDIIVARTLRRDAPTMRVAAQMASVTAGISVVSATPAPTAGQHMMIMGCDFSSVFQVTGYAAGAPNSTISHAATGTNPGNANNNLNYVYRAGARVAPLQTVIYYVANDATGNPSLYRQTGATTPAEQLIEGVEALQVAYGFDSNNDQIVDQYFSAANVTNWDRVRSVSYALLVRSDESGTELDNKTYTLLEAAVGGRTLGPFTDRRSRLVFTSTIALRNRTP
jgi:type IV pilus assembly protein PilW